MPEHYNVKWSAPSPYNNNYNGSAGGNTNSKADKVNDAAAGDFAGLDAGGNLTDSGSKASDFAAADHTHDTTDAPATWNTFNTRIGFTAEKHLNIFNAVTAGQTTICWPWVIDVSDKIASPLAKYYMIYSTDHNNPGHVSLAYSDELLSGWTVYGTVYSSEDAETASVMWDEVNSRFIMYYQTDSAVSTEAQSTYRLTSTDCISWSNRTKNFDIDTADVYGNVHNGYFSPFRIGGMWLGYSLMGGGNGGRACHYSDDGYTWYTDHRQLAFSCLSDPTVSPQRWLALHHGSIVFMRGAYYFVGALKNFTSGTEAQDNKLVVVAMNDMYIPIGKPMILTEMADATYEDVDIRAVNAMEYNGKIYVYYQCGVNYFNCIVITPDKVTASSATTLYTVTNALTNCTSSNSAATISKAASYSATITASSGYTLTGATVSVTMGGVNIISTAYSNGAISIASVTGNIIITISAVAATTAYTITNSLTNCTSSNSAASATAGMSYSATITAASGYTLIGATVSVTMGDTDITSTAYSGGAISIASVTGNIVISISAVEETAAVTVSFTTQPTSISTSPYSPSGTLTIAAEASDGDALTYQWYSNTSASNSGGTIIDSATSASYAISSSLAEGIYYYYCVAASSGITATSNVATVTVAYTYLAQYDALTGTANGAITSPIEDISGHDNDIAITGVTSYDSSGNLLIDAEGEQLYIASVSLASQTAYHIRIVLENATSGNNRVFVIPTLDFNLMLSGSTAPAIKFETTSAAFSSPVTMTATGDLTGIDSSVMTTIDIGVNGDVLTVYAKFYNSGIGTSVINDTITVTGFSAAMTAYGLYIGNNAAGTRPINRIINSLYIRY